MVGFGNVGRETAMLFRANGLNVSVYDPYASRESVEEQGFTYYTNLLDMLPACDIVSLHVPSTPETRKIIGKDALQKMKAGSFLINNARGDLVDEDALYEALTAGNLAGAAVDLMEKEPIDTSNKLLSLSNFIVTPHMAALTKECSSKLALMAAEGTLAVLIGEKWPVVFNEEVYMHDKWK
ncbi:MAG: NAD(P)-dependent oxidoreductase [Acetivibrionales bacterium]